MAVDQATSDPACTLCGIVAGTAEANCVQRDELVSAFMDVVRSRLATCSSPRTTTPP